MRKNLAITRAALRDVEVRHAEAAFVAQLREHLSDLGSGFPRASSEFAVPALDPNAARDKVAQLRKLFQVARSFGPIELLNRILPSALRETAAGVNRLLRVGPSALLKAHLSSDFQVLQPPYDVSWAVGAGLTADDGKPLIYPADGFSASGFGISFTADRHVSVSVYPHGEYTGGWANFDSPPPLRSMGGTGAVLYIDGELLLSRLPTLWNITNPGRFVGAPIHLPFGVTATPAQPGDFGPYPLAPVLFEIQPGARALLWFYIWELNAGIEGKSFITFTHADIPLVAVAVGPPLKLH